jgi:V8-like Glu-specific endopeptidase
MYWRAVLAAAPLTLGLTTLAVVEPATPVAPPSSTAQAFVRRVAQAHDVGTLFTVNGGKLGTHFCTASVVDSPAGDILVTAAHCMKGYSGTSPAGLVFVPGYNGSAPYGTWKITGIFVDSAWASSADPDDDVAFLTVATSPWGKTVEQVAGANALGIDQPTAALVRVTGYPDTRDQPITCQSHTSAFSPGQMQFDCANYTVGTSGSPFLVDVDPQTGDGMVIGVLGGYQLGGNTPNVSYSAAFDQNVQALYQTAIAHG